MYGIVYAGVLLKHLIEPPILSMCNKKEFYICAILLKLNVLINGMHPIHFLFQCKILQKYYN